MEEGDNDDEEEDGLDNDTSMTYDLISYHIVY